MAASLGTAVHASIEDIVQMDLSGMEDSETGWKLFRINLSDFNRKLPEAYSNVQWSDIRMMRLWVEGGSSNSENKIGIAKIEIVGSQWEEVGETSLDLLDVNDSYIIDPDFNISVVNTDENYNYTCPSME